MKAQLVFRYKISDLFFLNFFAIGHGRPYPLEKTNTRLSPLFHTASNKSLARGLGKRLTFTHPFTVVQVVWYELDRVGRLNM